MTTSGGSGSKFEASIVPVCLPSKKFSEGKERDSGSVERKWQTDTLYYNPLQDKNNYSYLTTPSVMQHLKKQGMVASDGSIIHSATEELKMDQLRKHIEEQKDIAKKVQERQDARLERLQKVTKANELVYTSEGVYEMDHTRRAILDKFTRNHKGELVRDGKPQPKVKKKRKRHPHVEQEEESRSPDTYILYSGDKLEQITPSPPPSTSSELSPGYQFLPVEDVFSPIQKAVSDTSPSYKPHHFKFGASNLPKATESFKEAIQARNEELRTFMNMPSSTPPTPSPVVNRRKCVLRKRGNKNESVPVYHSSMSTRKKGSQPQMIKKEVVTSNKGTISTGGAAASSKRAKTSDTKLPKIVRRPRSSSSKGSSSVSSKPRVKPLTRRRSSEAARRKEEKIPTPKEKLPSTAAPKETLKEKLPSAAAPVRRRNSQADEKSEERLKSGHEAVKSWTHEVLEKEKPGDLQISDSNVFKTIVNEIEDKDLDYERLPLIVPPVKEKAEIGIQTHEDSVRDIDRDDLMELLRELVVTPRQYLDTVMGLLEGELSQPDVNYNKMLRHIHNYSAIEDLTTSRENRDEIGSRPPSKKLIGSREQFLKEQELQKSMELVPPMYVGSSPVLATLAKHVMDDFMFDRNMLTGSMVRGPGGNAIKKNEAINYAIEHGAHGLHTSISFQPNERPLSPSSSTAEDSQQYKARPTSNESNLPCPRTPSMATCHFNKVSGEVYHMYMRKNGTAYFSMLSPKERGVSSHSSYLGSYRENKDAKMTLVASPSSLTIHSSENDLLDDKESLSSLDEMSKSVERVPGFTYYKYKKDDGSSFLTTVSPKGWGPSCPHTFMKAYRETKTGVLVPVKIQAASVSSTSSEEEEQEASSEPAQVSRYLAVGHLQSKSEPIVRPSESEGDGVFKPFKSFSAVECNFPRIPGKVYHLYERRNGSSFLSMLNPRAVAGETAREIFVGSYKQSQSGGKLTLVESQKAGVKIKKPPPTFITCVNKQNTELCEDAVMKQRPPSRELVEALLQASNDRFSKTKGSVRDSWIEEFINETKSACPSAPARRKHLRKRSKKAHTENVSASPKHGDSSRG